MYTFVQTFLITAIATGGASCHDGPLCDTATKQGVRCVTMAVLFKGGRCSSSSTFQLSRSHEGIPHLRTRIPRCPSSSPSSMSIPKLFSSPRLLRLRSRSYSVWHMSSATESQQAYIFGDETPTTRPTKQMVNLQQTSPAFPDAGHAVADADSAI